MVKLQGPGASLRFGRKTPLEDFKSSLAAHTMTTAPKDGTFIVAMDRKGDHAHIRWLLPPDLEPGNYPYWAQLGSNNYFDAIAWAPSSWTSNDFTRIYE